MVSQKSGILEKKAQQEFHVRIVHIDYYMRKPVPGLDAAYSQLQGTAIDRVPIVRIFGSTPSGQKTCVHIRKVRSYAIWDFLLLPCFGHPRVDAFGAAVRHSPISTCLMGRIYLWRFQKVRQTPRTHSTVIRD